MKDAFRQYLHAFYQHHKLSPLALCNSLRNMGFSINSKKRINGIKNPIAVICGMTINTNKLIYNIEHYARNNEIEPEEDSSDIEYFLYNSTISNNEDY